MRPSSQPEDEGRGYNEGRVTETDDERQAMRNRQ